MLPEENSQNATKMTRENNGQETTKTPRRNMKAR